MRSKNTTSKLKYFESHNYEISIIFECYNNINQNIKIYHSTDLIIYLRHVKQRYELRTKELISDNHIILIYETCLVLARTLLIICYKKNNKENKCFLLY